MRNIEFFGLPDGEVEVRMMGELPFILTQKSVDFINEMYMMILEKKPGAIKALELRYERSRQNPLYFKFLIVRGYVKCNFIEHDNKLDIDDNGNFIFEFTLCPRLGECKEFGVVCNSNENADLSEREIDVLRLIAQGMCNNEIAEMLYLSPNTVHNHRNNILKKLQKNNTAELVRYWFESGLK